MFSCSVVTHLEHVSMSHVQLDMQGHLPVAMFNASEQLHVSSANPSALSEQPTAYSIAIGRFVS